MQQKVIVIVGPTASGKTELAIRLAKKVGGEIISADSMQVYKGMEISSQSPTRSQQKQVRHHMVGFLEPEEEYSAARFSVLARKTIDRLIMKGKVPIVVGGSGLYIKALVDGIFPSKGKNPGLREKLSNLALKKGSPFLHAKLSKIDPISAGRIHVNDTKRVIRALEIYDVEKKTKESMKRETKGLDPRYKVRLYGLMMDRARLYDGIAGRVELMFRRGLTGEVKKALRKKLSLTSRQALGIRQLEPYFSGRSSLEESKETLKRDTRKYAKRQLTWFRGDKRIMWLDLDRLGQEGALSRIYEHFAC